MTNRERLAWALGFCDHSDRDAATYIADALVEITDDEDDSVAIIYGADLDLLTEWLGQEAQD